MLRAGAGLVDHDLDAYSSAGGRSTESSSAHSATVRIDAGLNGFISSREKRACPMRYIPRRFALAWTTMMSFPARSRAVRATRRRSAPGTITPAEPPRRHRCRPAHGSELLGRCSADVVPVTKKHRRLVETHVGHSATRTARGTPGASCRLSSIAVTSGKGDAPIAGSIKA